MKKGSSMLFDKSEHYIVLSKDVPVAELVNGELNILDKQRAPLYLINRGSFTEWLRNRSIDSHRTNSRLLKKILRLSSCSDEEVVMNVHAVTIKDTYWVKKASENISYNDVKFKDNIFDMVALKGDSSGFDLPKKLTPELTNTGSFEKCWKHFPDGWYMLKRGNTKELFSEIFISKLGRLLGFNMADYSYSKEYDAVITKDFTEGKVIFEDAEGFAGNIEDEYLQNYRAYKSVSVQAANDYANMLYLDMLCMNYDRHIHNYGILREIETGRILGAAPNYDNNNALLVNESVYAGKVVPGFVSMYADFFESEEVNYVPVSTSELQKKIKTAYTETSVLFSAEQLEDVPDLEVVSSFICGGNEVAIELCGLLQIEIKKEEIER